MSHLPRAAVRVACIVLVGGLLGGCIAGLGNTGGVLPTDDVGPPPSLRGTMPDRAANNSQGRLKSNEEIQASTARTLRVPTTVRGGEVGSQATGPRKIRREDLEGASESGPGANSGLQPSIGAGGSVGVGGKF